MLYGTPNGVGRAHALIAFVCAAGVTIPATLATGDPPCEGYWDNTIGQPGMSGESPWVLALTEYEGDLIAGGPFDAAGGTPAHAVARWDGRAWSPLGAGITDGGSTGWVSSLCVYENDVIAAGFFDEAGGTPAHSIARWDGSSWSAVGDIFIGDEYGFLTLHVHDGDLYAGGLFTMKDYPQSTSIARWDGFEWAPLGQGVSYQDNPGWVWEMTTYRGELIVGGQFTTADGKTVNNIARWDGTAWQPLGDGVSWAESGTASVYELFVVDDSLIVSGPFDTAGDVDVTGLAQWDGAQWKHFGEGLVGAPISMIVYQGELHVAGLSLQIDGEFTKVARWDGSQWHHLGEGIGSYIAAGGSVQSLATYGDALIAGGLFTVAGGEPTNYITAWYGCGNGSATPGDLNNDGAVDGADLAILLGAWGACTDCEPPANCPADLDDSCTVDGADLAILLGNWG